MENKFLFLDDPNRLSKQLDKFSLFKAEVELILKKYEEEYDIVIFYSSETGSRGLGIDVEDSDFDITGFFAPKNEFEYYKIIRTYERTIKVTQEKVFLNNRSYELDIELWDIKEWLKSKVVKNLTGCDFWFESQLIYRNIYPDLIEQIRNFVVPPSLVYWGKAKSGIVYNIKDIKSKGKCLNKSLMNVLTSLFQYMHYQIYVTFPKYNILEELDYLIKNKEGIISKGYFNEEEFAVFEECANLYLHLFEEKKVTRKSLTDKIPDCLHKFMALLENKYNVHKKKYELKMPIKEDEAQSMFDEVMKRNKK